SRSRHTISDRDWSSDVCSSDLLEQVRRHVGVYDFADMLYVRSENYVSEERRTNPEYQPRVAPLFGEKEGKIARANRGRDPLYLRSEERRVGKEWRARRSCNAYT